MLKSMHEQVVAQGVVDDIDRSLDLIKRAYQNTNDEVIRQQLRQQWNVLCEVLKLAKGKASEAIADDGE